MPGGRGAPLALPLVRRPVPPHVLVDHQLVTPLEQVDKRHRPVRSHDQDRPVDLHHRQPAAGRRDGVPLPRVRLLPHQQHVPGSLPGGQVNHRRPPDGGVVRRARHRVLRISRPRRRPTDGPQGRHAPRPELIEKPKINFMIIPNGPCPPHPPSPHPAPGATSTQGGAPLTEAAGCRPTRRLPLSARLRLAQRPVPGAVVVVVLVVHDHDRPLRAGGDLGGDAPGHQAAEPGPAVGAEDDEAGVVILGGLGDRLGGGRSLDRQGLRRESGLLGQRGAVRGGLLGRLLDRRRRTPRRTRPRAPG